MFNDNIQGISPASLYPEQADKAGYSNEYEDLSACPEEWRYLPVNGYKVPWDYKTNSELKWKGFEGYTAKQIQQMQPKAVGLILGERSFGVAAIDFDGPGSEDEFKLRFGRPSSDLPHSIAWTSGKADRRQVAFSVPSAWWGKLKPKQWEQDGSTVLEFRFPRRGSNLQSVIAGKHPETDGYSWVKGCSPQEVGLAEAAEWLLEALLEAESCLPKTFPKPQKDLSDAGQEHNKDKALEALKCLPAAAFEAYDSWLKVGMALHSVDEGFLSNWVEWSRLMSTFDEEECLQKWSSFSEKEPGEGIGLGSLIEQAKKYGYKTSTRSASVVASDVITWTAYLDQILRSIQDHDKDTEMRLRSEMMCEFRAAEAKINQALLKRFSGSKAIKVKAKHSSVRLGDVEMLDYYMEGWIIKGDIQLLYAPAGVGKTTLALRKCFALAKGENILDRDARCTPAKSLFIATDSGAAALVKAIFDLGIDPDDPLINPGPNQMIYIWAYEPDQGHDSWICDINGVVRLEDFIKANDIAYVACDSAKSVSSLAGWSYTDNTDVKTMLTHLRQCVCKPTGACIEFISHDGTKEGTHSGAKAWSEEPSMVCRLTPALNQDQRQVGVTAQFIKDRAATVDPRRSFVYQLDPDQNELVALAGTTVVSNCAEAVIDVLWRFHQAERIDTSISSLINECFTKYNKTDKTVRNTLGTLTKGKSPRVIKKRRGYYALSPGEIQRQNQIPPSPPQSRGHRPKPFTTTNKNECPNQ